MAERESPETQWVASGQGRRRPTVPPVQLWPTLLEVLQTTPNEGTPLWQCVVPEGEAERPGCGRGAAGPTPAVPGVVCVCLCVRVRVVCGSPSDGCVQLSGAKLSLGQGPPHL